MSAVIQETAKDAARRLASSMLRKGYKAEALHEYCNAAGELLLWRIRCKHPDTGDKWMRPMHWNGAAYAIGDPDKAAEGLPLYRLPELLAAADVPVYVVEGEWATDHLRKLGLIVTTSGSCTSVDGTDWTPLQGRSVFVWPDNDKAGAKYANAVMRHLRALGCTVRLVAPAIVKALPDKGDCVDWLAQHPDATVDDVRALETVEALDTERTGNAPEPLRRPVPPPEPYPTAELGRILAPACQSLRRVIQAPDAICGASLLAAASLAVQGLADVENDGRVHPLSLWMLTIAESGERKSAVDSEAMRSVRDVERELSKAYTDALAVHEAQAEEWAARKSAAKTTAGKSKGDGLADALRKLGPEPSPPLRPTLIAADFTAEGLAKLLAVGRPSMGAFTDEAALVFGGHGMTKETTARTAATLCKLWDSGTLDRIRATDGAVKLSGRRMALHLLAQPVIAERALSDDVLSGQGFLARCLLAWPEGTAGNRPYVAESLRDDPALIQYGARLADLLHRELPLAEGQRNELKPPTLSLSPDAAALWRTVHNRIEGNMGPGARYATCKPWASKTAEQCLRIAGVLTLVENPGTATIESATVERAAELALWHLNEAVRLAGTAELSPEVRDAEALLTWCHATGRVLLHSRDALRLGPSRIRDRETFGQAVGELVHAGWANPIEGGAKLDGRQRRYVWQIVPASEGD